jgi:hypothetical protein
MKSLQVCTFVRSAKIIEESGKRRDQCKLRFVTNKIMNVYEKKIERSLGCNELDFSVYEAWNISHILYWHKLSMHQFRRELSKGKGVFFWRLLTVHSRSVFSKLAATS